MRAAYIHKAEHLDARKAMMQWWFDYLDMCKVEEPVIKFVYLPVNEMVTPTTETGTKITKYQTLPNKSPSVNISIIGSIGEGSNPTRR